jgi:hypothetical protein
VWIYDTVHLSSHSGARNERCHSSMDLCFFSPSSPLNCASQEDPTHLTSDVSVLFYDHSFPGHGSRASSLPSHIELNELIVFQI